MTDLGFATISLIIDTEKIKNEDKHLYGLCDVLKNSTTYKTLVTLIDIHHYENIEAFEMTKLQHSSENFNYDIADNSLK